MSRSGELSFGVVRYAWQARYGIVRRDVSGLCVLCFGKDGRGEAGEAWQGLSGSVGSWSCVVLCGEVRLGWNYKQQMKVR